MRLVMTLKVRDEEDVLEANLRFHLAQGVDFFVVTDNGSTDRTPEILRAWAQAGLLRRLEEPADAYNRQHRHWVTRMARLAATEHGADWVINNDADEFWWPISGTLKGALASIPEQYGVMNAPRPEMVGRPDGPGSFAERLVYRETRSRVRHKVAHRAAPDVEVGGGSHRVADAGEAFDGEHGPRPSGRVVVRAVSAAAQPPLDSRWLPAPRWPVRILHFPLRSYEHYRRRVEITLFHGDYKLLERRAELLRDYESGRLPELYRRLVWDEDEIEAGLRDGRLVKDTSLRDFLAGCPDPLAAGAEAAQAYGESAPLLSPEQEAAELRANELDMMHSLHRADLSLRQQRAQARQRARNLKQERDQLRARLESPEADRGGA